jgi:hypothetical protein
MLHFTRFCTCILILLIFAHKPVSGQVDSTKLFERSKGTLIYPVTHFISVSDCHPNTNRSLINPNKGIVFYTDSPYLATAVFEGAVVAVNHIGDSYLLITKFGDYFLSYMGLTKPLFNIGDYILKGRAISRLLKRDEPNSYELEVYLTTETDGDIYPCDWFLKK